MGFKKIEPVVICSYNYEMVDRKYLSGYYILSLKEVKIDDISKKCKLIYYPKSDRNQSYMLKVSSQVSLFLILVGSEFSFVIKDDSIPNEIKANFIYINSIKIPIKSEPLNDNFWKRCMEFISSGIKRDLLIKEIFKYG